MAHAITNTNGFNEMAYIGEKPWHELGQSLQVGASRDEWLQAAGMAWSVQRAKIRFETSRDGSRPPQVWNDKHVLFRSDTLAPLGVASDKYKVVQPREVIDFFAEIARVNGLQLETAGTLHGGRQFWAMALTGARKAIGGVDPLVGRVLLATSTDGSMATTAKHTSERVVCANTLHIAMHDGKEAIKVKHSTEFDANAVRMDLGLTERAWEEFTQDVAKLAATPISKQAAVSVLVKAIGNMGKFAADLNTMPVVEAFKAQPNVRQMAAMLELFDGKALGANASTANGTAWGLVNAVTQYYDHTHGRSADARLSNAWFGPNANTKQEVFKLALELVGE